MAGSFYSERMALLEVNPENNLIWVENPDAEFPEPKRREIHVFEEDGAGNIKINFWNLNRQQFAYIKMGDGKMSDVNGKRVVWHQTRLKDPTGDMKYKIPEGQGNFPFLPPWLIQAWEKKETIETLFLTEGAFKAWLAGLHGAMIVGLTSITHYRDKETGRLHHDIERIINDCNVKNVVILWDGDCLNISEKQLYDKIDLSNRPYGFFNSAKTIKTLLEEMKRPEGAENLRVYFYHVKSDCFPEKPKGLDDLIIEARKAGKTADVLQEMHKVNQANNFFFEKWNITTSTNSLYQYFCLHNVDMFYHRHQALIKLHEFVFTKHIYRYDEGKNKVELVSPDWAAKIKWIGDDFFKIVEKPDAKGESMLVLEKRKKQTLSDLYGRDFQKYLTYYEGFCNVPDHFKYQQVHGKFYNRYHPFTWTPAPGSIDNTMMFIQHIFGSREVERNGKPFKNWELGLDYLQLMLTNPTQILPVLILFSPENNTGKSEFGKWQRRILGHNSIQIGNQDFRSEFNDHWADKLLAICEETLLDRKKDVEQIKAYATSNKITVNPKGFARFEIDFFAKLQFYSNNIRMIYVTKHDERFWINRVPAPKRVDPELPEKLTREIPAFLHFLMNREMCTARESRMWFHHSLIRTDTFSDTVKLNEPSEAQDLREKLKEMFIDFNEKEIMMPMKNINDEFFGGRGKIPWIKELLSDYLDCDQVRTEDGKVKLIRGTYKKYRKDIDETGAEVQRIVVVKFHDRPYIFHRKDFVPMDEEIDEKADFVLSSAGEVFEMPF